MKIVHIITGLNDGGAEAVLYRLCLADCSDTHIVVSLMDEGKYGPLLRGHGVKVISLGIKKGLFPVLSIGGLWRLLRKEKPDVVQTWMYHADFLGGVIARFAGYRNLFWGIHHSTLSFRHTSIMTLSLARLCGVLSGFLPLKIICCSQQAAIANQRIGYTKGKFVIIPNGYDLEVFQPNKLFREKIRLELGISSETPLLGMVARYNPLKDHESLLSALKILKDSGIDFMCLLVGTGMEPSNRTMTESISAKGLSDRVLLLGPRNDIPAIMNALDLHLLSSFGEAFPNVLAEAMACGVPCVATDVGDAAFILGETGWSVPPSEPRALAMAVKEALNEIKETSGAWDERKTRARRRILEHFEIHSMAEAYRSAWCTK